MAATAGLDRQLIGECRVADEQIGAARQLHGGVARACIDAEAHLPPAARLPEDLVRHHAAAVFELDRLAALQATEERALGNPEIARHINVETARFLRLDEAEAERLDAMVEGSADDLVILRLDRRTAAELADLELIRKAQAQVASCRIDQTLQSHGSDQGERLVPVRQCQRL